MAEQRVTGVGLEVLNTGDGSTVRVSSLDLEVLHGGAGSTVRVSAVGLEVLRSISTASPPSSTRQPVIIICQ